MIGIDERLWRGVDAAGPCWLWTGACSAAGYGQLRGEGKLHYTHRLAYELLVGPIPAGMTLDHLCRVRRCCNPDHLEAVTMGTNTLRSPTAACAVHARKTHCIHGHPFDDENTIIRPKGRDCRACQRARQQDRRREARR